MESVFLHSTSGDVCYMFTCIFLCFVSVSFTGCEGLQGQEFHVLLTTVSPGPDTVSGP